MRARSVVTSALVASALVLLMLTALSATAEWRLGTAAAVNALVCAAGVRVGGRAGGEARAFTALDAFVAIAFLAGSLMGGVALLSGVPDVPQRRLADLAGATHAEVSLTVFVAAVVAGWTVLNHGRARARGGPSADPSLGWPTHVAGLVLVVLGLAGLALRLRSGLHPGALASDELGQLRTTGLTGLLGTLLAPLIAVGSYLLVMDPTGRLARGPRIAFGALLVPLSAYTLATFSLNRAIFLVPAGVMVLVTLRTRRVRHVGAKLTLALVVAAVFFVVVGQARLAAQRDEYGAAVVPDTSSADLVGLSAEVYLQAPYFSGSAYSTREAGDYDAGSLVASALAPLPALGAPFRDRAGAIVYNRAIGRSVANDQILPLWAEVELSLGRLPMVVVGFGWGCLLWLLDRRVRRASSTAVAYAWTFAMLWAAQATIVSVSVIAQILYSFVAPLFLCLLLPGLVGAPRRRLARVRRPVAVA